MCVGLICLTSMTAKNQEKRRKIKFKSPWQSRRIHILYTCSSHCLLLLLSIRLCRTSRTSSAGPGLLSKSEEMTGWFKRGSREATLIYNQYLVLTSAERPRMYKFVSDSFSKGDASRCIVSLIGLPEQNAGLQTLPCAFFKFFPYFILPTTHFIDVKMTECAGVRAKNANSSGGSFFDNYHRVCVCVCKLRVSCRTHSTHEFFVHWIIFGVRDLKHTRDTHSRKDVV